MASYRCTQKLMNKLLFGAKRKFVGMCGLVEQIDGLATAGGKGVSPCGRTLGSSSVTLP